MFWIMTSLLLSAEPKKIEKIYVAPPTIHDPVLNGYQSYINSLLVATANSNTHWIQRSNRAESAIVMDKHTVETILDTTCNYNRPLNCGSENYHWVMITDIFTTENFATVVIKLYDENTSLIASTSKTSYSIEKCKPQIKQTNERSQGLLGERNTQITEILPDKCVILEPKILAKDINQAVTIMFASIHPVK
jgi:hypothetical protein